MADEQRYEKKYSVTVGQFASEKSAIDRAELCKRNGIMAEIVPINGSPIENLTAAVLLIAEKLNSIEKIISKTENSQRPEPKTSESLGSFLKKKREAKGMTQKKLADECGVSCSYICKIESEAYMPTIITPFFRLLAAILDFPVSEYDRFF